MFNKKVIMRPSSSSSCSSRPSLLKRKRTYSDDEDIENDPPAYEQMQDQNPAEAWVAPSEASEGDMLLSPDSIPSSEPGSESCAQSDQLTVTDSEDSSPYQVIHVAGPITGRMGPMPVLSWADGREVWGLMCQKDALSVGERDEDLFSRHPNLSPRMRSILLDWLIEVCEVYKLHRETYHLCMDFIDRYLSKNENIPKQQLQLIGITCLFIAAKVEEIYPPKIAEFAFVTDGACTEAEITDKELIILKTLKWNLSPVTANSWLNMYLQLLSNMEQQANGAEDIGDTFVFPQFSGQKFVQTAQLLDLCMLDEHCLRFPYGILAAGAVYHTFNQDMALRVSGQAQGSCTEECEYICEMMECISALRHCNVRPATKCICTLILQHNSPKMEHSMRHQSCEHNPWNLTAEYFTGEGECNCLQWTEISKCVQWMKPFAEVLNGPETGAVTPIIPSQSWEKSSSFGLSLTVPNIVTQDSHLIQTHSIDLKLLEKAQQRLQEKYASAEESPVPVAPGLLTPPASHKKALSQASAYS